MAGLFTLQVKGGLSSTRAIDLFIEGADTEQILDQAAAVLLNRIRTRYQQEVDPEGNAWKPSQRVMKYGGNTLIKTGKLLRSIQLYNAPTGMRLIGTDVFYAPYLHYGNQSKGNPARAFMAFNDEDLSLVASMILARFK